MGRARTDRGRVSRLVTRTLLVLGGTVAATAIGWLISSATASADTLPDLAVPGTHAAPAPVANAVTGVLDAVGVPARVPTISPPPAVTGALSGAVTQLGSHVPVGRDIPVTPLAAWPVTPPPFRGPAPGAASQSGPAIGSAAARPITAETTVAPIPPGPATVVRSVTHASPVPLPVPAFLTPPVPGSPVAPAPWSPVTVPAAPGGSVGNAPGAAGLGLAEASAMPPVPGLDVVRVLPVTAPPGLVTAGKQPGSTPD